METKAWRTRRRKRRKRERMKLQERRRGNNKLGFVVFD